MNPTPIDNGSHIPNLFRVDDLFWRGGQPPDDDSWNFLYRDMGVRRIIKLNGENEGDNTSDIAAEALGIELIYCPIPVADQLIFKPNKDLVKKAVEAFRVNCFVHCSHGQDRTGLVIGCWRVWKLGDAKQAAWQEMIDYGFHPELLGLTLFWEWCV